ncbi:ABC transporter permease [Desulfosediminicola flagellatus]|uniref:ABC transporter permease n=1 Tax=Desulfosediminicola flagellatus TaxID=2569541 RepID=UPI0010AD2CA7|nr:ABC transporter permease [Desulfosediminicola flagellatus]
MNYLKRILRSREGQLVLFTALFSIAVGIASPSFLSLETWDSVLTDSAILMIMASAQMMVILTRGIDLTVAANIALTGMIAALIGMHWPDTNLALIIACAVLSGLLLGMLNGVFIALLGIPAIVVSLGAMTIYRGMVFVLSGGQWVNSQEMPASFTAFPLDRFAGLTNLAAIGIIISVLGVIVMHHTRFGRELYAIGGNPAATDYVGINTKRRLFAVYAITGALAGLCGYLWVARFAIAYTEIALGFELLTVAACVIGGVGIAGGTGTVFGAVLGALFLGVLQNALPVMGISPFWQMAVSGTAILAAVIVNSRGRKQKGMQILRVH